MFGLFKTHSKKIKELEDRVSKLERNSTISILKYDKPVRYYTLTQYKDNFYDMPIKDIIKDMLVHLDLELEYNSGYSVSETVLLKPKEKSIDP